MATEALKVIAATQLANKTDDFVFIISLGFYLIILRNGKKVPSFIYKKMGKGWGKRFSPGDPFRLRPAVAGLRCGK